MEKLTLGDEIATIAFSAEKLADQDFLGKSDPFFTIYKETTDRNWVVVYTSEVISNCINPKWKPFCKSIGELCDGDYEKKLKIRVVDHDHLQSDDEIGSFTTTMSQLKAGTTFKPINENKKLKQGRFYRTDGNFRVDRIGYC